MADPAAAAAAAVEDPQIKAIKDLIQNKIVDFVNIVISEPLTQYMEYMAQKLNVNIQDRDEFKKSYYYFIFLKYLARPNGQSKDDFIKTIDNLRKNYVEMYTSILNVSEKPLASERLNDVIKNYTFNDYDTIDTALNTLTKDALDKMSA